MKKKFEETCLIEIGIGDWVEEKGWGRVGTVKDIKITPDGRSNPRLVAVIYVYIPIEDKVVCSTSNNWVPHVDASYEVFYPGVRLSQISDKILEDEKMKEGEGMGEYEGDRP